MLKPCINIHCKDRWNQYVCNNNSKYTLFHGMNKNAKGV